MGSAKDIWIAFREVRVLEHSGTLWNCNVKMIVLCVDDAEPRPDPDMDLRDAIQKIAVEWPAYGRPRVTHELRERGW